MSALNSSLFHLFNVDIIGLNLSSKIYILRDAVCIFECAPNNLTWGTHTKDQSR